MMKKIIITNVLNVDVVIKIKYKEYISQTKIYYYIKKIVNLKIIYIMLMCVINVIKNKF
jgi:hypothetical protein